MKISESGLDLIRRFEGLRLTAYQCAAGKWTIGYGHTAGVKRGQKISRAKAEQYLLQDVRKCEKAINSSRWIGWTLAQNQFDALCSFAFNLGAEKIKSLCDGRSAAVVADKLLLYNKAAGKFNKGLFQRREAERALFVSSMAMPAACPYQEPTVIVTSAKNALVHSCSSYIPKGDAVRWVQWHLNATGKYDLEVDGVCGELTTVAIMDFQSRCGLVVDGLCGKATRAQLRQAAG